MRDQQSKCRADAEAAKATSSGLTAASVANPRRHADFKAINYWSMCKKDGEAAAGAAALEWATNGGGSFPKEGKQYGIMTVYAAAPSGRCARNDSRRADRENVSQLHQSRVRPRRRCAAPSTMVS